MRLTAIVLLTLCSCHASPVGVSRATSAPAADAGNYRTIWLGNAAAPSSTSRWCTPIPNGRHCCKTPHFCVNEAKGLGEP